MFQSLVGDIVLTIDWSRRQISVNYFLAFLVHPVGSEIEEKIMIHKLLQLYDIETFQNGMYQLQYMGYESKTRFHVY